MNFWGSNINLAIQPTDPINTDVSTMDTINQMKNLAVYSSQQTAIITVVQHLLLHLPNKFTNRDIARLIWYYVHNSITFTEDEETLAKELGYWNDPNQELLIAPEVLISMPIPKGDCDDYSTLVASMLLSVRMPVWFITVAVDEDQPWRFSHVYVKTYLEDEGKFMVMDCSHGSFPGWETSKHIYRRMEWLVS